MAPQTQFKSHRTRVLWNTPWAALCSGPDFRFDVTTNVYLQRAETWPRAQGRQGTAVAGGADGAPRLLGAGPRQRSGGRIRGGGGARRGPGCLPCAHTGRTPGPLTPAVSRLPRHSPATRLSITEGFRPLPSSYFLNDQGQIASPRSSESPS